MQITSIILAAGYSTRMGTDKAMLKVNNSHLIDIIINKLLPFSNQIIIVTGKNHQNICDHVKNDPNLHIVHNPNPENGMFSSLKLAIKHIHTYFALIHLIDHPFIKPETYRKLIDSLDNQHLVFKPVISGSGRSGHPVLISKAVIKKVIQAPLNDNLRNILHSLPQKTVKRISIDDQHILDNINTKENLDKIRAQEVINAE